MEVINKFVVGSTLPVDVDDFSKFVKNLVESTESSMVEPAIEVDALDDEEFLSEAFGDKLLDTGLAGTTRSGHDGGLLEIRLYDGFENAGEVIDFGVAMRAPRSQLSRLRLRLTRVCQVCGVGALLGRVQSECDAKPVKTTSRLATNSFDDS